MAFVTLVNESKKEFRNRWDGTEFVCPAGESIPVDSEMAMFWLGDPKILDESKTEPADVLLRQEEENRMKLMHGEKWAKVLQKVYVKEWMPVVVEDAFTDEPEEAIAIAIEAPKKKALKKKVAKAKK